MLRRAGRSRLLETTLLLVAVALATPTFAQEPAPSGDVPATPGQAPTPGEPTPAPAPPPIVTPFPAPVPVIPQVQPIGPPATVPSAPVRVLPSVGAGLPLGPTFQIQPTISVTGEYTDNFGLTERNKESNFRSTVSPGLLLGINTPVTQGLISYTFSPAYDTATEDFSYFHSLLGQVVWQANPRWRLTLADTLTRSDQPGDADRLGLRQERRTFTSNILSLDSDYLIGRVQTRQSYRLSTFFDDLSGDTVSHVLATSAVLPILRVNSVSAGYEYLISDSEPGSDFDSSTPGGPLIVGESDFSVRGHQFTAGASRELSRFSTVGLRGTYALRTATSDTDTDEDDFRIWSVSLFTAYALPGGLTVDGSLGMTGLTSSGESVGPNFSSSTSISYQFTRALVGVAFDSGFSETFSAGQNFGVVETQGVTGYLSYLFTPSVTGRVSGTYRRNEPTGFGNQSAVSVDTTTWQGTAGLTWRIQRRLSLELTYSYVDQDGGDRGFDSGADGSYTENRVQAAFRVVY